MSLLPRSLTAGWREHVSQNVEDGASHALARLCILGGQRRKCALCTCAARCRRCAARGDGDCRGGCRRSRAVAALLQPYAPSFDGHYDRDRRIGVITAVARRTSAGGRLFHREATIPLRIKRRAILAGLASPLVSRPAAARPPFRLQDARNLCFRLQSWTRPEPSSISTTSQDGCSC